MDLKYFYKGGVVKGQVYFKILVAIAIIFITWFTACDLNPASSIDQKKQISEIANFLGIVFPDDAKIVFATKNDRNGESAIRHIIYTTKPVAFKLAPSSKTPAEDSIEILKEFNVIKKPQTLKDKWTYRYEGMLKDGEWSAHQTNFNNCSYLDVQQLYF